MSGTGRPPLPWLYPGDVLDDLVAVGTTALGLAVAVLLVDGVGADGAWGLLLVALVIGVGDLVLRWPLRAVARWGGVAAAIVAGQLAQVLVAFGALTLAPGIEVESFWAAVAVLVITGIVMALGRWAWGANDADHVVGDLVRRARRQARHESRRQRSAEPAGPTRPPGAVVVMFDGVALPVLEQAVEAGLAPTVARWLSDGSHDLTSWWAQVPATTPASQAALLHGDADQIPAFRWWDRDLGRLVVANHPADAALIEARLPADGLLIGGGTAVSVMFSGGADSAFLVMSRSLRDGRRRPDLGPGAAYLRFFASPFLFARALALTLGEMVKELFQARRQRANGVQPRIGRGGWYVLLRGVTNVLLRDLSTTLVAEAMVRGDPVVFVDLVDYDEIAHHAGPVRPESLRALEGLDGVLRTLEQVAAVAPRDYDVVVLSDHGQALGATFEQVNGSSLLDVVRTLMADPQARGVEAGTDEDWGPVNAVLASVLGSSSRAPVVVGPQRGASRRDEAPNPPEVVVGASGNLGLIWFPRFEHRLTLEELQELWPDLVPGLASRPAVGAVLVDSARGLVAVGARGLRLLEREDDAVEGEDPTAALGPRAAADLARAGRLPHTGDVVVVSTVDDRGRVHAFEGQVGSHGGLGGDQNRAFLLHPSRWAVDDDLRAGPEEPAALIGGAAVHRQLMRWLRAEGIRR